MVFESHSFPPFCPDYASFGALFSVYNNPGLKEENRENKNSFKQPNSHIRLHIGWGPRG